MLFISNVNVKKKKTVLLLKNITELQQFIYLNNECNQNLPKAELISGLKALEGENFNHNTNKSS